MRPVAIALSACLLGGLGCEGQPETDLESTEQEARALPQLFVSADGSGFSATFNVNGPIDVSSNNPFFHSFGTNGRTCGSCHVPSSGWGITPSEVQARFNASNGLDPIFRTNDGSNAPNAPVGTVQARRAAYSMLLKKGLIRVGIGVPATAEFELAAVDDPYHFASATELSLFRRPLPSTNLKFLSAVMWDGRESTPLVNGTQTPAMLDGDLGTQSNDATLGHAAASAALPAATRAAIVAFEKGLLTAQISDRGAGLLNLSGATGGPGPLVKQAAYFGINDVLGADPMGKPFNPDVFVNYASWATDRFSAARRQIARGQALFNRRSFKIQGVRGVNDALGVPSLDGTCTTCHDTPNAGNHSTRLPLDLGLTDASRRTPDMPLYALRNKTTGEMIQTTDPGRALITGKWKDVSLFKGPVLRALASRPPYFHNGFAANLSAVVDFYDQRFAIGLTAGEKADLAAFLGAL